MENKLIIGKVKNSKQLGEIGERIAIGELSKYGLDILLPMSDNLPFDFAIYYKNKIYRCQVKSSFKTSFESVGSVFFSLVSNNWQSKKTFIYNDCDIDLFILCDGNNIYLYKQKELQGKKSISIRMELPKNKQLKNTNLKEDVILSQQRLEQVLTN